MDDETQERPKVLFSFVLSANHLPPWEEIVIDYDEIVADEKYRNAKTEIQKTKTGSLREEDGA